MKKYVEKYTYSSWKNGSGWQIQDCYMGIDDNEYPEGTKTYNMTEDDVQEEINWQLSRLYDFCDAWGIWVEV